MSRPIAAIEVNEIPDGGPAVPVELTTDAPSGGPALPVVRVAAGSRAQQAIAPVRMSLVSSGTRARTGRRPVPIVVVAGDTPVTPVVPPSPLLTDLAARWSMNEAAGIRLDSGPNLLHLAVTGTPTQEVGKLASAVGTSSGNYLSHADHAVLQLRLGMTWALWVKDGVNDNIVFAKDSATGREYYLARSADGFRFPAFGAGGVAEIIFDAGLPTVYRHVVVTLGLDGFLRGYINAALIATSAGALPGAPNTTSTRLDVGQSPYVGFPFPFAGSIDELTIWHRALAAPEIAQLYNGGAGLAWPYS